MKVGCFLTPMLMIAWKILKFIFNVIIMGMVYIIRLAGLYVPMGYILFALILHATWGIDLTPGSTDSTLMFIGLGLCIMCAAVILIKNLLYPFRIRPFKASPVNIPRLPPPPPRYEPRIYRSGLHPDLIVHEYPDKFELYRYNERGRLELVRIEYRNGNRY